MHNYLLLILALAGCANAQDPNTSGQNSIQENNINKQDIPKMNGFDLSDLRIPLNEIHKGGPPRDGIPAIDNPKFIKGNQVDFLNDSDEVLAITKNGISKAYPISILNYHEVVNDVFDQEQVAITFCPLCGSGVAFSGMINGKARTFGVSGLLYNSDVLLYDRETESLWSQLIGKAVSGSSVDQELEMVAMEQTTWKDWKSRNPNTLVLSTETGYARDYNRTPYAGYELTPNLYFPVNGKSDVLGEKDRVIGISIGDVHKAYAFDKLFGSTTNPVLDTVNGTPIQIHFNAKSNSAKITDAEGNLLSATTLFWFAWYAFHPDTMVF